MLFYEPAFATFFCATYALYLLAIGALSRKWILLIASLLFYFWGEPVFVLVLLLSAFVDYALSFHLNEPTPKARQKIALAAGLGLNLGILVLYKYADFLITNLNYLFSPFGANLIPLLHIALPIGVSFVVFEKITYLVDTWRGVSRRAESLLDYCLFVMFFPKLLAGPILKYHEMKDQIAKPAPIEWSDFGLGFVRFARGMGRKLLIADPLGSFVNKAFDNGPARMLGFRLRENFNSPYISQSLTEFWQRWHMSLTSWIRDYLYIPLGGNRRGNLRTYVNLWICFLLSGLWHGASWNFVLWGAYNGLFLTLDRIFLQQALARCGAVVARAATLFIVVIGWAIFRSEQPGSLGRFVFSLFATQSGATNLEVPPEVPLALLAGVVISLFPATRLSGVVARIYEQQVWLRIVTWAVLVVIFILALARAFAMPFQPFIYFRF